LTATSAATVPDLAALMAEANEHFRMGRMAQAQQRYQRVVELDPAHARALYVLGGIALNDGNTAAAIDLVRRAIDADPHNGDFHFSLGNVLVSTGRSADAIPCFQAAVRLRPDVPEWLRHLAVAMHAAGRHAEAVATSITVTGQPATDAQTFLDLGTTLHDLGRLKEAEAAFQEAVRLSPETVSTHVSLAANQQHQGRPVEAEIAARHAVDRGPENPDACFILGYVLSAQARHVEAAEYFSKAVEQRPGFEGAWNGLLFAMTYSDRWSAREIFEAHVRWGQRFALPARRPIDPSHRHPGHRLRIAYLSPDYRQHPVAFFMEAPLTHHDRTRFEVFGYHTDGRVDATTRRLKALADHWRWMVAPSEQALEQVIREDGIDILVELSGHTEGQQLGMLARRVAPVQMTYLGYPNSTGLAAIDYRITDARADPPGEADSLHVEKLLRLPETFLCYTPPESTIDIAVPPARRNGFITFGSFNNFAKLSPTLLGLWAKILTAVPGSRLMIKTRGLEDPGLRTLLRDRLERAGLARERLRLVSPTLDHSEHMDAYGEVDIALDAFPYHGTTTTLDALWMGVPVISLAGDRHASRVGLSILACLELTELIACSPDEYVATAVQLAADEPRLEQLRKTLRTRLAESALTDGKGFTARLEQAFLRSWTEAM
jgi:protein O-GlcNAc transferase